MTRKKGKVNFISVGVNLLIYDKLFFLIYVIYIILDNFIKLLFMIDCIKIFS